MQIRHFAEHDVADGIHGPQQNGPHWRRTLVAAQDEKVIGRGTALLSATHRERYRIEIDVDEGHRRRGVGRSLYERLRDLRSQPYPFMARAMASRPERLAFATALGFGVLMTCPSPQVDPTAPEVRQWVERQPPPEGFRVVPATAVPDAVLADSWVTQYEWTHASWAPITSHEAVRTTFEEQFLPTMDREASVVVVGPTGIEALALVSGEVWDGRTFLLTETVRPDPSEGGRLVAAAAAAMLRVLASRHVPLVEFEGHHSDTHISVITSIPAVAADPLTILLSPV